MRSKIKVSAVSYTNTKPFIHGLDLYAEIYEWMDLSLDVPAVCADKLVSGQVDIGLVPVATLLRLKTYHVISDYCIGAVGAVRSVYIFSEVPIQQLTELQLDEESRTSNLLAQILLQYHWKIPTPTYVKQSSSRVLIGDRTFGQASKYPYAYDLAEEWQKFTGLPFVFAAWVANKTISSDFIKHFNKALQKGLDDRLALLSEIPLMVDFDLKDYLMHRIDYTLDEQKQKALALFLEYGKKIV